MYAASAAGMTVLIIDDDRELCSLLQSFVAPHGWHAQAAHSGHDGLRLMVENTVDLVILDVMLPGLNGFEVLRRARQRTDVPVVMLTARVDHDDRLRGFDAGADDYLPKPFEPSELLARMRAVLRRVAGRRLSASEALTLGPLRLVPMQREAWLRDQRLDLTEMEYDILELLARAAGRAVTRDELFGALYHRQRSPVERTIDVHVSNLRRKLGEDAGGAIQAVRGVGYRMRPSER